MRTKIIELANHPRVVIQYRETANNGQRQV